MLTRQHSRSKTRTNTVWEGSIMEIRHIKNTTENQHTSSIQSTSMTLPQNYKDTGLRSAQV